MIALTRQRLSMIHDYLTYLSRMTGAHSNHEYDQHFTEFCFNVTGDIITLVTDNHICKADQSGGPKYFQTIHEVKCIYQETPTARICLHDHK